MKSLAHTFVFASLMLARMAAADPLLSPQEAVKRFTAPEGFSVDLLAAEPDVVQPIAFCWDAKGRIWVVEGMTYPTRATKPPAPRADKEADLTKPSEAQKKDIFAGKDRILIFEDSDGNGSFETRKVFIEGLNLVSGIELGFGGVYVGAAPYLLHIPLDEKTDKPAGDPIILADGWGYQDTHETLNSFIWGPDGWLYGCHGVFTHSEVRVCHGTTDKDGKRPRTLLNCAYWRYHPVRHSFEVFAHGTSNSWGFDYNENGDWFSEACVIPHFWHIIQGGYYLRQSNPLGHFNPYVYTNIETIADHQHFIGTTPHSGNGVSDAAGGGHAHCGLCIYNGDNFPPEYRGRAMFFNIHGQRINQEQLVPQGSGYVAKHLPDFIKANDKNFTGVALKVGPDGAVYFIDWYDMQKCHRPQPEIWDRSNGRLYRVKYDKTWKPFTGQKADPGFLARRAPLNDVKEATTPDQSYWSEQATPRKRLAIASALQRLPLDERWSIVEALLQHAEDATDHNLPQMYWYAIEPLVPLDTPKALALAEKSKIPLVAQHIARRAAETGEQGLTHLVGAMAKEKTASGMLYLLKAANDGLKGRVGVSAPKGWDGAYANVDDVVARRPDAKEAAQELKDLRQALAVAFGDQRVFPQLREIVRNRTLPTPRRQQTLRTLVSGKDPELPQLVKELLDDPELRLNALQSLPQAFDASK